MISEGALCPPSWHEVFCGDHPPPLLDLHTHCQITLKDAGHMSPLGDFQDPIVHVESPSVMEKGPTHSAAAIPSGGPTSLTLLPSGFLACPVVPGSGREEEGSV